MTKARGDLSHTTHEEDRMNLSYRLGLRIALVCTGAALGGCLADEAVEPTSETTAASEADCVNGANGFIDIPDSLRGTVERTLDMGGGVTATLESTVRNGAQIGFTRISGNTGHGDAFSFKWTRDNWAHFIECGPFQIDTAGQVKTTAAMFTSSSSSWQFKACGAREDFAWACTRPW